MPAISDLLPRLRPTSALCTQVDLLPHVRADGIPAAVEVTRGAVSVSGGCSVTHLRLDVRAARCEPAARRAGRRGRAVAHRSPTAGCATGPPASGCCASAPRCTACCMLANSARVGAFSTIWPAYITAISSVCRATTPRSWVTSITDMLRSRRWSWMRSRIWACTVTSSAVVGSSANSSGRAAGEGDGDHHSLAHAAGQLVRVLVEALRGSGMPTSVSSRSDGRRGVALGSCRGGPAAARRSACRSSSAGSATSSGPGRSSPSPGPRSVASACMSSPPISSPSKRTEPWRRVDARSGAGP